MGADSKQRKDKNSPSLSFKSVDETTVNASEGGERYNAFTSSFETDLSAPRRTRREDPSQDLVLKYQKDSKYAAYVQVVERCLQSFDYVSEWADVTAFLTKLERSFKTYSRFAVVPHKETVGKRLAQCLNPALPTGVHQKALGIYEQIFRQIGQQQLIADLALYAYGLFPFMRNASLNTKPQLLDIFSQTFVPLGANLRPCMKSFTAGVLPGLEEASVEISGRVMDLLDRLRETVDTGPFFYQTLFLVMITNAEQRESALKYLAQRLPVFTQKTDVEQICGDQGSLMVRALAASLADSKTLVLRAALDVVMTRIPLRAAVLEERDVVLLVKSASEVVLKKDMSLNRRFYTWVLGAGETDAEQNAHFAQHAHKPLTKALLGSFAATSSLDHQHMVLRVLIGLIDKLSIAQPVLDTIFVPLLQQLMTERDACVDGMLPVKLASVSRMFVEMLDPIFTWSSVINQLTQAAQSEETQRAERIASALRLLLFLVQTFELDDDATLQVHVPMALLTVLATLDRMVAGKVDAALCCGFTRTAIELLTRVPTAVFAEGHADGTQDVESLYETTRAFYSMQRADSTEGDTAAVEQSAAKVVRGTGLLYAIIGLSKRVAAKLGAHVAAGPASPAAVVGLEDICHILRTATAYARDFAGDELSADNNNDEWTSVFAQVVTNATDFGAVDATLSTLLELVDRGMLQRQAVIGQLDAFVERLWATLSTEHAGSHVRAVQLLCLLRNQADAAVERRLAAKLAGTDFVAELPRYAVFWRCLRMIEHDTLAFVRLLLLVIDNAQSTVLESRSAARAWIVRSAGEWEYVLETLFELLLLSIRTRRKTESLVLATGHTSVRQQHEVDFDCARITYYLSTLQCYLELAGVVHRMVSTVPVSTSALRACEGVAELGSTWMQVAVLSALDFALTDAPADSRLAADVDATRARAAELAVFVVTRPGVVWPAPLVADMQARTVDALLYCVLNGRTAMQLPLLDLLTSLIGTQVHTRGPQTMQFAANSTSAGIAADPRMFSRLVLAAFTMQLDVVALSRWVQFLHAAVPFIQQRVDAEHSVLRWMVLPSLHTLRLVLAQCAVCFARPGAVKMTRHRRSTSTQLFRRLVPLFVIPVATDKACTNTLPITVDVLTALLDAYDVFLTLCLRNIDRVPTDQSVRRPDSRASDTSLQSGVSLGAIPIVRFVSSIFGQDAVDESTAIENTSAAEDTNTVEDSDIDSVEFNLVVMLAVVQDVWEAFDHDHLQQQQQQKDETAESRLLREFGVDTTRSEATSDMHVQQSVRTRIAALVEHASAARPAEVTLAIAALWVCDNPQWNTRLDVSTRITSRNRRRRRSSASSVPTSRMSGLSDSVAVAAVSAEPQWNWRAPDLLERVPGRAPAAILTTLLNDLHLRTTQNGAVQGRELIGDAELARFIELFAQHRLTARASAILVPHVLVMLREYTAGLQHLGAALPFILRMFTELCSRAMSIDTASRTPELGALYAQLVDACVGVAARTPDGETVDRVLTCVADMVVPQLAHMVPDFERQVGVATHLMQQIISPALRAHMTGGYSGPAQATTQTQHFAAVLQSLAALAQQTSLAKVWRRDVWDFYGDAKFFSEQTMAPTLAMHWKQLVRQLLVTDKDRVADLLSRIAASAPGLFANRVYEAQTRALALRRLSFAVWAGTTNQYLSHLPHVQERLVDILKNAPLPVVQCEVFLCLRVLLCRISNHHMSNFWPMLLTELIRLCLLQLAREGPEDREQAQLFLAACKFLDLLFVLGTEDFLIHQWVFITDTIDALYGSPSASHALLDRLSTRLLSMPSTRRKSAVVRDNSYPPALLTRGEDSNLVFSSVAAIDPALGVDLGTTELQMLGGRPLKRPIISVRSVASIKELDEFVHNASAQTFQEAFTMAEPDMEYIDALLMSDLMFLDFTAANSQSPVLSPAGFVSDFEL